MFDDVEREIRREKLSAFQNLVQRTAIQIFHYQISDLLSVKARKAEIRNVNNIRMPEASGSLGFAAKSLYELMLFHILRHDDLNGDVTLCA